MYTLRPSWGSGGTPEVQRIPSLFMLPRAPHRGCFGFIRTSGPAPRKGLKHPDVCYFVLFAT